MSIDVGKSMRVGLAAADKSMSSLAVYIGATRQQVHYWSKKQDLKVSTVASMADYFGLTVDEFLKLGDVYEPENC